MAQETTTAKRCETCGRLGACPMLRRGQYSDLRKVKMENTPGYCNQWEDGQKVRYTLQGNGADGSVLLEGKDPVTGEWVDKAIYSQAAIGVFDSAAVSPAPVTEKAAPAATERIPAVHLERMRDLGRIEARIDTAKRQTMGALLEIGRCLNEAKDKGLVPHGQFEAWAADQTGMGERTRQRIMQAAREVPAGSAMERLDFTKTMTLLALPEGDREDAAEKAEAENTPLRQLQEEVNRLTQRNKQLEGQADRDKVAAEAQMKKAQEALAAEKARADTVAAEAETLKAKKRVELMAAAGAAMESPEVKAVLDAHAKAIADLRLEKFEAERYAEEQARLRQEAQQEMLRLKSQAAHGQPSGGDALTGESLAEAVRVFLGAAGVLPHMGKMLCQLTAAEREKFQRSVAMLAGWVEGARRALDMVVGEMAVTDAGEV